MNPDLSRRSEAFDRAYRVALRLARKDSATAQQAEDVAQEVCARLSRWQAAHDGSLPDNPEAWATTVTTNIIIDEDAKAKVRHRPVPDQGPRPRRHADEEGVLLETLASALRAPVAHPASQPPLQRLLAQDLLARLAWGEREVRLMMLVADGVPHAEIAEELGYKNAAVVKTTVGRMRSQALAEVGGTEGLSDWLGQQRPY